MPPRNQVVPTAPAVRKVSRKQSKVNEPANTIPTIFDLLARLDEIVEQVDDNQCRIGDTLSPLISGPHPAPPFDTGLTPEDYPSVQARISSAINRLTFVSHCQAEIGAAIARRL